MGAELVPLSYREAPRDFHRGGRRRAMDALSKQTYVNLIRQGYRRVKSAELVGVSYDSVVREFSRDGEFAAAVREAEDARVDEVEEALYQTAIGGHFAAQQFILFNRRADQWTDPRTMREREQLQREAAEQSEFEDEGPSQRELLRSSLLDIRSRMIEEREANAAEAEDEDS